MEIAQLGSVFSFVSTIREWAALLFLKKAAEVVACKNMKQNSETAPPLRVKRDIIRLVFRSAGPPSGARSLSG